MQALATRENHEPPMSAGAELLERMIDEGQLTAGRIAFLLGCSTRSVYYKLSSTYGITIEEWRRIFEDTRDMRIVRLLLDPDSFVITRKAKVVPGDGRSLTNTNLDLAESCKLWAHVHELHMRVLADGRVDEDDDALLEEINRTLPEAEAKSAQIRETLNIMRDWKSRHGKAVKR